MKLMLETEGANVGDGVGLGAAVVAVIAAGFGAKAYQTNHPTNGWTSPIKNLASSQLKS